MTQSYLWTKESLAKRVTHKDNESKKNIYFPISKLRMLIVEKRREFVKFNYKLLTMSYIYFLFHEKTVYIYCYNLKRCQKEYRTFRIYFILHSLLVFFFLLKVKQWNMKCSYVHAVFIHVLIAWCLFNVLSFIVKFSLFIARTIQRNI